VTSGCCGVTVGASALLTAPSPPSEPVGASERARLVTAGASVLMAVPDPSSEVAEASWRTCPVTGRGR